MLPTSIDWEKYLETFPDRYIRTGLFDRMVNQTLQDMPRPVTALDIGGGREGTLALKSEGVRCWLADPFIHSCPDWMESNLGHIGGIQQKFDLIVARGSFNYLSPIAIGLIPGLLNKRGIFMFNTFVEPHTGERPFINSKTGKTGIEKFEYRNGIIYHQLILDNETKIIKHHFNAYSIKEIEMMLESHISYIQRGNSLYVTLKGERCEA